jgi:hypothetical protein
MLCEAYLAVLPLARELEIPDSQQMVTVWPVSANSMADDLNKAPRRDSVCDSAVDNYGLVVANRALDDARRASLTVPQRESLAGRGPLLLAWSPATQKGQSDALVLVTNLSNVTTPDEAKFRLLTWKSEILQNPDVWRPGWKTTIELGRIRIREFYDQYGPIIEIFGEVK